MACIFHNTHPCNGLSCYYTNGHDRIWNSSSDGKCTCNDTANLNIQPACHETAKPLWPCTRSTDTVYVTRWKRMELLQEQKCTGGDSLLPAKSKLLSLRLFLHQSSPVTHDGPRRDGTSLQESVVNTIYKAKNCHDLRLRSVFLVTNTSILSTPINTHNQ